MLAASEVAGCGYGEEHVGFLCGRVVGSLGWSFGVSRGALCGSMLVGKELKYRVRYSLAKERRESGIEEFWRDKRPRCKLLKQADHGIG